MNHLTEEQLILHYYGEEGDTLAAIVRVPREEREVGEAGDAPADSAPEA